MPSPSTTTLGSIAFQSSRALPGVGADDRAAIGPAAAVQRRARRVPDAGVVAAERRGGIVEVELAAEERDVGRPEIASARDLRGDPGRVRAEHRRPRRPAAQIARRLRRQPRPGLKLVETPAAEDRHRIVGAEVARQRHRRRRIRRVVPRPRTRGRAARAAVPAGARGAPTGAARPRRAGGSAGAATRARAGRSAGAATRARAGAPPAPPRALVPAAPPRRVHGPGARRVAAVPGRAGPPPRSRRRPTRPGARDTSRPALPPAPPVTSLRPPLPETPAAPSSPRAGWRSAARQRRRAQAPQQCPGATHAPLMSGRSHSIKRVAGPDTNGSRRGRDPADKPGRWRSRAEHRTGAYLCVREERSGGPAQHRGPHARLRAWGGFSGPDRRPLGAVARVYRLLNWKRARAPR